jgi:ethanolamine transporter EutH
MKKSKNKKNLLGETDSAFLLKIVLYIILASVWVKFQEPIDIGFIGLNGIPIGLFIGLLVARQDKFQIDRKIEYVVLIVMTIVTYFIPAGIVI